MQKNAARIVGNFMDEIIGGVDSSALRKLGNIHSLLIFVFRRHNNSAVLGGSRISREPVSVLVSPISITPFMVFPILRCIFNVIAVKQRLIVNNPTNGTKLPKNNYAPKQILNDEQLDKFIEVIKIDKRWCDFFFYHGCVAEQCIWANIANYIFVYPLVEPFA